MADVFIIPYRSSVPVECVHPRDVIDPDNKNPLDNTTDGSTSTFIIYDRAAGKNQVLGADEASGQTVLSTTNAGNYVDGESIMVDLDDGTIHDAGAITSVDASAGTITVTTGLASAAAAGQRVRRRLGPQVTMTEFGTPSNVTHNFGFRGVIASDHADLEPDMDVDIEISFVGAAVGGLDLLLVLCARVENVDRCGE